MAGANLLDPEKVISFDSEIRTAVRAFLKSRNFDDFDSARVISDVIMSLPRYREEGKRLLPVVYWARDLDQLLSSLNGCDPIAIGEGPLSSETARRALKQCAPLGEGRNWVVYMIVAGDRLKYGVFRSASTIVEPTTLERLRRSTESNLAVIGIVQLSEGVIELRCSNGHHKYVVLPITMVESNPPLRVLGSFLQALTRDVPEQLQTPVRNLYYRTILDVLQVWQGTLVVVLPESSVTPIFLKDGIWLETPLNVTERVRDFIENPSLSAGVRLQATVNLIRGVMGADGITVLGADGTLLGYNVFLQYPTHTNPSLAPMGGARRRTYEILNSHVGQELVAAFYRSQDGAMDVSCQI